MGKLYFLKWSLAGSKGVKSENHCIYSYNLLVPQSMSLKAEPKFQASAPPSRSVWLWLYSLAISAKLFIALQPCYKVQSYSLKTWESFCEKKTKQLNYFCKNYYYIEIFALQFEFLIFYWSGICQMAGLEIVWRCGLSRVLLADVVNNIVIIPFY